MKIFILQRNIIRQQNMADLNHRFNFRFEPCFELNSSLMSRIFFFWTYKLIQKGNQTHLEMEDLSDLREDQQPKYSAENIKDIYNIYNKEQPNRLFKSLKKILSGSIIVTGILVTVSSLLQFSQPLVIGKILEILKEQSDNNLKEGYFYVTILIICYFVRAYLFQHAMHFNNLSCIKTVNSINFLIFNKITKLSSASRKYLEAGTIMNNVNVDVNSIQQMVMMIYRFFNDPITILISMVLLVVQVGWIGLLSPLVCFICMGLQQKIMKKSMDMRKHQLIFSDQRSKCMSEYFSGIKIIKYYGWEKIVQTKIQQIRNKQLSLSFEVLMLRSYVQILLNMIPIISSIIIFSAFVAINGEQKLTPSKVYTVLAIFNMLAFPMRLILVAFISYINGTTSLNRIQHFLNYQERSMEGIQVDDQMLSIGQIKIQSCKFNWETTLAKQHFSKGHKINNSASKKCKDTKKSKKKGVFLIDNIVTEKNLKKKKEKKKDKKKEKRKKKKKEENSMNEGLLSSESEFQNKLDKKQYNLYIQHLEVNSGQFISIIGKVGSGKTTFLSAILGQIQKISGSIRRRGKIGYISQTAWLLNATIKENILFAEAYDEKKYNKILQICELLPDLELLQGNDMTQIGENGVNLSGGQKQRIALARAIYSNADIYLIDDCLSALDGYVGKNIFMNVLKKQLHGRRKTILFVTNSIQYTEECDRVIILERGQIIQSGVPQILLQKQESKYRKMKDEKRAKEKLPDPKEQMKIRSKHTQQLKQIFQEQKKLEEVQIQNEQVLNDQKERDQQLMKNSACLVKGEQRLKGSVPWKFYYRFFTGPGKLATFLMLLFISLTQVSRVLSDWWLGQWSSHELDISFSAYIWIYSIISVSVGILLLLKGIFFGKFIINTSRIIQRQLINVLLKTPLGWFDVTPTGRILARTTKDQDDLDNSLSFNVQTSTQNLLILLSSIILITIATPIYLIIALISGVAYSKLSKMYMNASRQIKRLSALRSAPLISHFQQVISGIYTIRAFQKEKIFNQKYFIMQKDSIVPNVNQNITSRWISLVTDMFSILTIAAAGYIGIASVIFKFGSATPNMIGLALLWSLNMNMIMSYTLRILADTQSNMNAVVRLYDYIDQNPAQKDFIKPRPSKTLWPSQGIFQIRKISYKYRNQLPLVIKSISFDIKQNAKIGVVGRTGSGKSTLTLGLLRILQLAQNQDGSIGQIILDQENITNVGLYYLRHNISIIPQDPILFSGTIRSNLDPDNEYQDIELVQCLKKVQIWEQIQQNLEYVNKVEGKLYKKVDEAGKNFSQGQKQLICLARALIRQPKVLLMDQATASIDEQTDQIIQKMIKKQFTRTTVITIAHRLNTLANYDKILVLSQGQIQEYDTPNKLINDPNSFLGKVIRKVGEKYLEKLVLLTHN